MLVRQSTLYFEIQKLQNTEPQGSKKLSIGCFDYIAEPANFLQRMRALDAADCIFSFPKRWTVRTLPRWIRLNANSCPVYFYGASQVEQLLRESGWEHVDIHNLSRDYIVHARVA